MDVLLKLARGIGVTGTGRWPEEETRQDLTRNKNSRWWQKMPHSTGSRRRRGLGGKSGTLHEFLGVSAEDFVPWPPFPLLGGCSNPRSGPAQIAGSPLGITL